MANIDENKEEWRLIPETNGRYYASNLGRVKSIKKNEKILNPYTMMVGYASGYKVVGIKINNKYYTKYVHRIVAELFLDNINKKPQVNHVDGNSLNNNVSNLEWVSAKENINHAWDNGLIKRGAIRITAEIFSSVIEMRNKGFKQHRIARDLSIDQSSVSRIINRKRNFSTQN